VQHCMTVWTYWPKIIDGINLIFLSYLGDRDDMVYMNEPLPEFPITLFK